MKTRMEKWECGESKEPKRGKYKPQGADKANKEMSEK